MTVTAQPSSNTATLSEPARRFLQAVRQRKGRIIAFVSVTAFVAAGISLLLPKWFVARATILPPPEGADNLGIMSALVENTALNRLGLFTSTTTSDIYVEILKSRTLREPVVVAHDLSRLYKTRGMERTLKEFDGHVRISVTPTGVVTIRAEDRDPARAASIANALVAGLDRFNRESVNTRAKRTREFLEERLEEVRIRMSQAESVLTAYEQKNRVVASSEASAVSAMAGVISQKLSLEVRRSYMSSYTRPGSSSLREVEAEIGAMDRELAKLPSLKQEGSRLALDAEIQRRIFTLLTAQYEDMRVQEMRDTPTLTLLDPAHPPEIRARPKRGVIVMVATLSAAVLALGFVALTMPRVRA